MKKTEIKLSFYDTSWIVNGPATVCRIECSLPLGGDIFNMYFMETLMKRFPLVDFNFDHAQFISTGISKTHPNDVNNELIGRRLAESRAKMKAYQLAQRILTFIADYLDSICQKLDDSCYGFSKLILTEESHITDLEYWAGESEKVKKMIESDKSAEEIAKECYVTIPEMERALKFLGY